MARLPAQRTGVSFTLVSCHLTAGVQRAALVNLGDLSTYDR